MKYKVIALNTPERRGVPLSFYPISGMGKDTCFPLSLIGATHTGPEWITPELLYANRAEITHLHALSSTIKGLELNLGKKYTVSVIFDDTNVCFEQLPFDNTFKSEQGGYPILIAVPNKIRHMLAVKKRNSQYSFFDPTEITLLNATTGYVHGDLNENGVMATQGGSPMSLYSYIKNAHAKEVGSFRLTVFHVTT